MKSVWYALDEFVSSMDKLRYCKLRMRWQNDGDKLTQRSERQKRCEHPLLGFDPDAIIVSGQWEVNHKRMELSGIKDASMDKLAHKKLHLQFLFETEKNLEIRHYAIVQPKMCLRCKNCLKFEVRSMLKSCKMCVNIIRSNISVCCLALWPQSLPQMLTTMHKFCLPGHLRFMSFVQGRN
jgi:hypothetical protein